MDNSLLISKYFQSILEENQEKMQKSIDVSEVADIFDIKKIEVE